MLPYISWPEFGLFVQEQNCNTTEKSTINYTSTENAVLSLCSMNIAKEPLGVSLHLLVPVTFSLGTISTAFYFN